MKLTTGLMIAALSGTMAITPLAASAQGQAGPGTSHQWHHHFMTDRKPYTEAQIKILAEAFALRRVGPDAQVVITPTKEGTYKVSTSDGQGHLLFRTELNEYGYPVMEPGRHHHRHR